MRSPFPLQWPQSQPRTVTRERGKFSVTLLDAAMDLLRELDMMGAVNVVITSDLPTRRDGLPYSTARCHDPGIALYFVHNGVERVIACDRWDTPAGNLRSIGLTIASLRGIARWGSSGMVVQALAGFAALPDPARPPPAAVLDVEAREIPPRMEWDATACDRGDPTPSSDYVDGWNDALGAAGVRS